MSSMLRWRLRLKIWNSNYSLASSGSSSELSSSTSWGKVGDLACTAKLECFLSMFYILVIYWSSSLFSHCSLPAMSGNGSESGPVDTAMVDAPPYLLGLHLGFPLSRVLLSVVMVSSSTWALVFDESECECGVPVLSILPSSCLSASAPLCYRITGGSKVLWVDIFTIYYADSVARGFGVRV